MILKHKKYLRYLFWVTEVLFLYIERDFLAQIEAIVPQAIKNLRIYLKIKERAALK